MNPIEHGSSGDPATEGAVVKKRFEVLPSVYDWIESGAKTLELRIARPTYESLTIGDIIEFAGRSNDPGIQARIIAMRRYASIDSAMANENIEKWVPGMSRDEAHAFGVRLFRRHEAEAERYGWMAIGFERVTST